jgi:hypothetical protein
VPDARDSDAKPWSGRCPCARKLSEKFIAMTVDGNGAYVYLDPMKAAKLLC